MDASCEAGLCLLQETGGMLRVTVQPAPASSAAAMQAAQRILHNVQVSTSCLHRRAEYCSLHLVCMGISLLLCFSLSIPYSLLLLCYSPALCCAVFMMGKGASCSWPAFAMRKNGQGQAEGTPLLCMQDYTRQTQGASLASHHSSVKVLTTAGILSQHNSARVQPLRTPRC